MTQDLRTPDGTRIALHRLGNPDHPRVLLVPGTFSNHTFWLGTRGIGFARTLVDAGFEACVVDPRGHGHSERPSEKQLWDIDDWAREDVPTALRAIASADKPVFMVGHSAAVQFCSQLCQPTPGCASSCAAWLPSALRCRGCSLGAAQVRV